MKIEKLLFILLLILVFSIVSSLSAQTSTPPVAGDGSAENPYQIATLDNLYWLTQNYIVMDKHFIQTSDINASDSKNWDGGKGFKPIGLSVHFSGYYNGNGHVIDSVYINRPSTDYVGVFSYVVGGALTIDNLGITNANITARNFVGILLGRNNEPGTTVSNCYSTGSVAGRDEVGGLIGRMRKGSLTEQCYSSADVSATYKHVGGLVGYNYAEGTTIKECYSTGSVTAEFEAISYFGGLVGQNEGHIINSYSFASVNATNSETTNLGGLSGGGNGTIDNCYSTGAVTGGAGSIYGLTGSGTVTNSFWDIETSGIATGGKGTGKTTVDMKNYNTYTDITTVGLSVAWDFITNPNDDTLNVDIWDIDQAGSGYPILSWQSEADSALVPSLEVIAPSGSGTEADPYKIKILGNLIWLSEQLNTDGTLNKHYVQTADINAAKTKDLDDGNGFKPISDFSGTYDGQGHTIDGLFISRDSTVGLFDSINNADALIKNLGLTNVDITGSDYVGALVGKLYKAVVKNCYSSGKVETTGSCVGGLIGGTRYGAKVECCYSSATVKAAEHRAGGLIGYIQGETPGTVVKNCYSSGRVSNPTSGDAYVGGLVGELSNGSIDKCYSRAVVSVPNSTSFVGGLVGNGKADSVKNSSWDMEISGQAGSFGGTGKTTVEMKDYATYTFTAACGLTEAWDFVTNPFNDSANEDIWDMDQNGSGYPILTWQPEADDILEKPLGYPENGDGSKDNPFQIATLENLKWLSETSNVWGMYFIQTADINASETKNWNDGRGFTAIGIGGTHFIGFYDGAGHIIDSLYINRPDTTDYQGLFSWVDGGSLTITNLGVTNANITARNFVGILVGRNNGAGTTVSNCYTTGRVTGRDEVGGLIGRMRNGSLTEKCYSSADVSSNYARVGGLVGMNRTAESTIRNCYSTGSVRFFGAEVHPGSDCGLYFGGLVGYSQGSIYNSYSIAKLINCTSLSGGLVSDGMGKIENCFWNKEVPGVWANKNGTGKTTVEMKDYATYTNTETLGLTKAWDFVTNPLDDSANEDIWDMEQNGSGYPILTWQPEADDSLGNSVGVDDIQVPMKFTLEQNYPNPFNPSTVIRYSLPNNEFVTLKVYNILGKEITTLVNQKQSSGTYEVNFDASNLTSGIYFYQISTYNFSQVRKMMLLK